MENICRTIYGSRLQSIMLTKDQSFSLQEFTTLNEYHDIQAGIAPPAGVLPQIGYLVYGNGGHSYSVTDGVPISVPVQHSATDAALYKPMPMALRLTTNDLSEIERARYALRKQITINNVNYYAYYAKRLDMSNVATSLESRVVANGTTTVSAFVPTISNLNPQPPVISTSGTNLGTGDYVASSTKLNLSFSAEEVTEILNAAKILKGNENFAIMSEMAIVSGVDKIVSATSSVGSINFNEVIAAQCYSFFNTKVEFAYSKLGYSGVLDLGSTEPLYNLPE